MADLESAFEQSLLLPDETAMIREFKEGKQVGEDARVSGIRDQFTWKRTFVNCWTGNPNAGKSTFLNFMATVKSQYDDWKWCIWSREMINAYNKDGKVYISASDIYDELIHSFTGKNPYKHFDDQFGIPQMSLDEYLDALDWVEKHFYIIEPKDKQYKNLIDTFTYFYEKHGFDGWIIDPFKNIRLPDGRTDEVLHEVFDDFKECSLKTNTSVNIVAHPRSIQDNKKKDGSYKVITQFDLLGGSAWNNSMDGIFSNYRPFMHKDPNDRRMWLYHLKQRKKHLVGKTGVYKKIEFDWRTNRYYFDEYCPLDGSYFKSVRTEFNEKQAAKKEKEKDQESPDKKDPEQIQMSFEESVEKLYDQEDEAPF